MPRRCLAPILFVATLLLSPFECANAESLPDPPPRFCQVRSTDPRINAAFDHGRRASATFRELVDRINVSDVVVYVIADARTLRSGVDGQLTFLSATGGFRYVVVHVNAMLSTLRLVSVLAHELQHAREIAETAAIVDGASMAREYAGGLGYGAFAGTGRQAFDSHAAIRAGQQAMRELLAGE